MSSLDENDLVDTSEGVIRKVKNEYCIFSKEGKSLGCYKTKESATKRLRQIEFFKRNGFVKGDLVAKEASDMVHYESAKAASKTLFCSLSSLYSSVFSGLRPKYLSMRNILSPLINSFI